MKKRCMYMEFKFLIKIKFLEGYYVLVGKKWIDMRNIWIKILDLLFGIVYF